MFNVPQVGRTPRVRKFTSFTQLPRAENHLVTSISNPGQNNTNALCYARPLPTCILKGGKNNILQWKLRKIIGAGYTRNNCAALRRIPVLTLICFSSTAGLGMCSRRSRPGWAGRLLREEIQDGHARPAGSAAKGPGTAILRQRAPPAGAYLFLTKDYVNYLNQESRYLTVWKRVEAIKRMLGRTGQ